MKRLLWVIRIVLSLGTTYIMIHLIHPELILLPVEGWTWYNLFNGYNFWGQCSIVFIISMAIFYWAIPVLLTKFLINKIESKYNLFFKNLPIYELKGMKYFFYKEYKFIIKYYDKINWRKDKYDITEKLEYQYFSDFYINMFTLLLHFVICYIFLFSLIKIPYYILIIILVLYFVNCFLIFPIYKNFINFIDKVITHELRILNAKNEDKN